MKYYLAVIVLLLSADGAAQKKELHQLIEQAAIPGLQVAYTKDNKSKVYALGVANNYTKQKITTETMFQAASLTKPVVAYGVLKLVEKGLLHLDTPLLHYYSYPRLTEPDANLITARMVLNHTTGLPNWGPQQLKLKTKPGTRRGYSGEGFQFLRQTIEHLTKKSMEEIIREEVFIPLGMQHSSFVWKVDMENKVATGHTQFGDTLPGWRPGEMNAASSLFTTATDYSAFLQALIQAKGLQPSTYAMMTKESSLADAWGPKEVHPYIKWGLGVGLQQNEKGKAIWHWGDNFSFRCFFMAFPDSRETLVYFTNSENGLRITEKILKLFFGDGQYYVTKWNSYGTYDEPAVQARLQLGKAWLTQDTTTAKGVYQKMINTNRSIFGKR